MDGCGRTMTVAQRTKVSEQISKEPSKGILARGINSGLLVTTVKRIQKRLLEPISLQNMDSTEAIHKKSKKDEPLRAIDFRLGQRRLRKLQ